jgi:penicillin-binding protein 2
MYDKRIKIFVTLIVFLLVVCLFRLIQMQLLSGTFYRDRIAKLKLQKGLSRQLKTVRGKILDRKGRVLAIDEPQFHLHINYELSCFMDERVRRAKLLRAAGQDETDVALSKMKKEIKTRLDDLQQLVEKCVRFGFERADIENKISEINNRVWNLRIFQAWRRNCLKSELFEKYRNNLFDVKSSDVIADFEKHFSGQNSQFKLINKTNIAEMHESYPLLELKTDDDIFTAQLEFMDIDGISILPKASRFYQYGPVASQTIGWVGPAMEQYRLPSSGGLSRYLPGEVCGREHVEFVCETILRGRRGEVAYDIDGQLVGRTETEFGKDVTLTLDIELQQRIEEYLVNCDLNPNCESSTAAVVIDVETGDVLALVSVPTFDLNRVRYDYDTFVSDPNEPLRNRAINRQYPPGSVVKPLILITAFEAGKITADEVIPCPARKAPRGWPSCWLYNRYRLGHDDNWENIAHNAVKGSCNIYFSRLADRIEPLVFQQWLFEFGYGHKILLPPDVVREIGPTRNLGQAQGQISNIPSRSTISRFEHLPALKRDERRYFGIGQGNLRATPLQVANAMAAIARGGFYKLPRLYIDGTDSSSYDLVNLNISPQTMNIVRDGMSAVVNEPGGTAYKEFAHAGFAGQGVEVYGKTGSTEQPDDAWFAGFAEDSAGRGISIAVVVEGGQHGSSDAGPLARDIIQFCIDAGYIGESLGGIDQEFDVTQ